VTGDCIDSRAVAGRDEGSKDVTEPRVTRSERARRRGRRRTILAAGVAALLLAPVTGVGVLRGEEPTEPQAAPAPSTPATTTTLAEEPATVATTLVESLGVRAEPNAAAPMLATLGPVTGYGFATTLLVDSGQAASSPGWVPVLIPFQKPNSTLGWVPAEEVALTETTYEIEISLSRHELVLLNAGEPVLSTAVILGTPETPTPPGRFYVTDPLNCNTESVPGYPIAQCSSAYGAFAIGISGLSEALDSFDGTIPQLAVHGTDLPPTELGKDLSNGCVRIPNDVVLQMAQTIPLLGVPVTITA
jgi:lipoprotein-anchoring transpeptidase ErfK/SrfK